MRCIIVIACCIWCGFCEPVVLTGSMVPRLLNQPLGAIRLTDHRGCAIPFQIDERDSLDEYILPGGSEPNTSNSNGILDTTDEIVFLFDDADTTSRADSTVAFRAVISATRGRTSRFVWAVVDSTLPFSPRSYIAYNHSSQTVTTPVYYAVFGHNRFHFIKAGMYDAVLQRFNDLTAELRIRIQLRALWGLISIAYTEENMVCTVKRYKTGPLRLIRRGDFHLNLGLWVEGSHAAVHQICYSDMVSVPVYAKLPIRLKMLFKEAFLEMVPQLRRIARTYIFEVPRYDLRVAFDRSEGDTLIGKLPDHTAFTVHNGTTGFGWLLNTSIPQQYLRASSYVVSRKTRAADSTVGGGGFRIALTDLPAGSYLFSNWVYFSNAGPNGLHQVDRRIQNPATITVDSKAAGFNLLDVNSVPVLRPRR